MNHADGSGYRPDMGFLARILRLAVTAVVLLIVAGIVLHLLHANGSNGIVSTIYDADNWLVSPFANVFHPKDADVAVAVNWGLAALVYAIAGFLLASLLLRLGVAGRGGWLRRRRGVTTA
jgi:hypothetical protein